MSMFHELMMRKKEEIMYATIKGALTENDGVFSGFSSSNYLQIQDTFNLQDIKEIVVKINLPSSALNKNKYEFILVKGNFRIACYSYATYFGAAGIDVSGVGNISFGTNFQPDTDYWLKYKNDGVNCSCAYSTDGTTWVAGGSKSASTISSSTSITYLGLRNDTSAYFDGSIDLNNSYIKIGATKYNLQAVVGYTVVGNPTIVDGVVSGFGGGTYLQVTSSLPDYTKLERFVKFNTGTGTNARTIIGNSPYGGIGINVSNQVRTLIFTSSATYTTVTLSTILSENTTYYYRDILENGITTGYLYDSNMVLLESKSQSTGEDFGRNTFIGRGENTERPFTGGTIYLNETYIKINNKLWFNGQQA